MSEKIEKAVDKNEDSAILPFDEEEDNIREVPTANIDTTDEIWNLFWNTPFNGDQSNGKCNSEPNNVRKLLFRLAKQKAKRFPASEIIESPTKIEDVWRRVVENKHFSNF